VLGVQDNMKVPEPLPMLAEAGVHDILVEFVVTVRVTVPAKPFTGVTVTVEEPVVPALTVIRVGAVLSAKSWIW